MSAENVKILKELKLPLPSKIKNQKLEDIRIYQKDAEVHLDYFKTLLKNKAIFYTEKASSKAKESSENPRSDTKKQVKIYNVLGDYINNISNPESYAEKTGQGIIHFNNPLQLIKRLELLAGSIFAGSIVHYLTRSYPFTFEPRRTLYCPVSSNTISEMRFYVTDSLGRPVDLNGIDWFMTLILHSK